VTDPGGSEELIGYDKLLVGTGAVPVVPRIDGPGALGAADGVHLLHSMGDTCAVMRTLTESSPATALIVGAGYTGLEMADALITLGLSVTQVEQLPEVLPTVDPELGRLVHAQLSDHGADVLTGTTVTKIGRAEPGSPGRLCVEAVAADGQRVTRSADLILVVVGVRPDTELAAGAGAILGARERSPSTGRCAPACPPSSQPGTASLPIIACWGRPTCHSERPPKQGRVGRRKRSRRQPRVRRQPRHSGRQDLRARRGQDRPARP
jgi:NADPH-dependent 2,4-dienoyl-CoA reductase/sulfur reductase-like enzyme